MKLCVALHSARLAVPASSGVSRALYEMPLFSFHSVTVLCAKSRATHSDVALCPQLCKINHWGYNI